MRKNVLVLAAALMAASTSSKAQNDSAAQFYKGKQIILVVGYGPGGGYDIYARLLARHMSRKMPGEPAIVVQNMPGAGSLRAANHIYNNVPRDGTVIGTFSRNMPMMGTLGGNRNVQFDARKFTWLGSPTSVKDDANLLWVRKDSGITNIDDLTRPGGLEVILGSSAEGSASNDVVMVVRDAVGARIKLISGYRDSNALFPAIERGEIQGRFVGISVVGSSQPHWFAPESPVHPILQFARATRHPRLPNVPTAREKAKDEASRILIEAAEIPSMLARPFVGPPDIPADRAKALQIAFMAAANDPEFAADGAKIKVEVSPVGADEAMHMLDLLAAAPQDVKDKLRDLFGAER